MRHHRLLSCLIAALLLMQWSAALLPGMRGLARAAAAQTIEICDPTHGLRSITIDADGKEIPKAHIHAGCPLCLQLEHAILPMPPAIVIAMVEARAEAPALRHPGLPPLPARAPPQQPRAPPIA
ncbi:DUF2946 family protein [Acetobacteraceae bacterium H6797]|nr:DUF2946 family protein [Acetobacteraceae bacterium H6797]